MDKIIKYNNRNIKTFKELREFLSSINSKYIIKYDDVFLNTKPDDNINMTNHDYLKFSGIRLNNNGDSFADEQSLCYVDIEATLKYNNINYKYEGRIWIILT